MSGFVLLVMVPDEVFGEENEVGFVRAVSDDVSIGLGGTLQPRVTFASDEEKQRVGFGLHRLRLRFLTDVGQNIGIFLQMEGSGASAYWQDIRGDYLLNEKLTLRLGRFVGAQPRAYARTSHARIDAIDRPAISEKWARMTIGGDGRDYGVEALWNTPAWELRAFLHNGYNGWNFGTGISRTPLIDAVETDGRAFSAAVTHWPYQRDQLEIGAYASINTSQNPLTVIDGIGRNHISWSAHAYWGPSQGDQPYRVKTELIGISYEEVASVGAENYVGGSLFGGYLVVPHIELFAMGEYWYGDGGKRDAFGQVFGTLGGAYSLSALQGRPFTLNRIVVTYSLRTRESDSIRFENASHVMMMQAQFFF